MLVSAGSEPIETRAAEPILAVLNFDELANQKPEDLFVTLHRVEIVGFIK